METSRREPLLLRVPGARAPAPGHSHLPKPPFISQETPADGARLSETLREPGPGFRAAVAPEAAVCIPAPGWQRGARGARRDAEFGRHFIHPPLVKP